MLAATRTRCGVQLLDHDVRAGSQWGGTQDGRGDVAARVGGTRLWDARCYCWTTARRRGGVCMDAHQWEMGNVVHGLRHM